MSTFWSLWIVTLTILNLVLIVWVLFANLKREVKMDDKGETLTTGHVYDGIEEFDNPLPSWWFYMFVITIVFSVVYLVVYPGLGAYQGLSVGQGSSWTSARQLQAEQAQAQTQYDATFGELAKMNIPDLAKDGTAMKMGSRLFVNNCAVCHGADAGGNVGYPSLIDKDWLYGGSPERIKETITLGRKAAMPAWSSVLSEAHIAAVTEFVLKRAGREYNRAKADVGEPLFAKNCAACHGADGKGNQQVGAPNLIDKVWLYGAEPQTIRQTIRNGRNGVMPAHEPMLKPERIHLLAAYVYSLSQEEAAE
jgi:cytochrome c oxidase cbb3-type subunit III